MPKIRDPVKDETRGKPRRPRDQTLLIRINADLKDILDRRCSELNHSKATVVNHLIVEWLGLRHDV